nr:MAG TPA: chromosomal replication initiator protein [Caudoviricetes sp.]
MIKSEIFASVLRDVCEVTGITEPDIMSKSKSEEIVDARHLLVVTLRRSGYYPGMIAERLHVSGRAVRKMINSFRSRADNSPGLEMCLRRVEARRNGNGTNADNLGN